MKKRGELNDSDKIFVTVALWIACITVFVVALSLYMLPADVSIIVVKDGLAGGNSKFNNLILMLASAVTAAIVIISAQLKRRGKMQRNFASIMLFSIMLSLCMGGVIIYGIINQFVASGVQQSVNYNGLIVLFTAFALSVVSACFPKIVHTEKYEARAPSAARRVLETRWAVGSYGYILVAVACCFVPGFFVYIPFAAAVAVHVLYLIAVVKSGRTEVFSQADD